MPLSPENHPLHLELQLPLYMLFFKTLYGKHEYTLMNPSQYSFTPQSKHYICQPTLQAPKWLSLCQLEVKMIRCKISWESLKVNMCVFLAPRDFDVMARALAAILDHKGKRVPHLSDKESWAARILGHCFMEPHTRPPTNPQLFMTWFLFCLSNYFVFFQLIELSAPLRT